MGGHQPGTALATSVKFWRLPASGGVGDAGDDEVGVGLEAAASVRNRGDELIETVDGFVDGRRVRAVEEVFLPDVVGADHQEDVVGIGAAGTEPGVEIVGDAARWSETPG